MSDASTRGSLVIGIDLGGTNMQLGVVDQNRSITARIGRKTNATEGPDAVIGRIVDGVDEVIAQAGISRNEIAAVGIACAGAIDIPRGIVLESPNLKWRDLPLRDRLQHLLGLPVVLENDVNGAVWGEFIGGAARDTGAADVLGAWIGTGVGGGLVINGRIFHGAFFTAGEIGHTIITPDGPPGARTVEDHCSRTGMARKIKAQLPEHPDSPVMALTKGTGQITGSSQFAEAVEMGCTLTQEVLDRGADLLGIALANWVTVLALDTILLGGGIVEAMGEPYLQRVRDSFDADVFPDRCKECRILPTELREDAGLLGAAALAMEITA